MCGRSALSLNKETLQCACSYKDKTTGKFTKPEWVDEHNDGKVYSPSYNIAPTDITPVLVASSNFKKSEAKIILKPMMWGIIPPWHEGDYRTHKLTTNNCRLEGIKDSKLYGTALRNGGRCVIVAEGFYEWQTTNKTAKTKQPYYIYAPQDDATKVDDPETWNNDFTEEHGWKGIKLLYMAGVYSVWKYDNTVIYSYSVITMASNNTMDWLHHRMPAILETEEQIETWLDIDNVNADMALSYLRPIKMLSSHPVSTLVNNSRNKSKECNNKVSVDNKKQKSLTDWFGKGGKRKGSEENDKQEKKLKQ